MAAGRKKVVETPEFEAAVAAQVQEQVSAAMEKLKVDMLAAAAPGLQPPVPGGVPVTGTAIDLLSDVLSKLSMNMAAIGQQGQRQRPLSPDEVASREASMDRLKDLILACREEGAPRPEYKLIAKTNINERMLEPYKMMPNKTVVQTEIIYTGVPNDAMVPLNRVAEQIFAAWRGTTGGATILVPTADVRPLWVTAKGLVVKGDPPKRQFVAAEVPFNDEVVELANGHPGATEIAVVGTVARKARVNNAQGVV